MDFYCFLKNFFNSFARLLISVYTSLFGNCGKKNFTRLQGLLSHNIQHYNNTQFCIAAFTLLTYKKTIYIIKGIPFWTHTEMWLTDYRCVAQSKVNRNANNWCVLLLEHRIYLLNVSDFISLSWTLVLAGNLGRTFHSVLEKRVDILCLATNYYLLANKVRVNRTVLPFASIIY